MADASDPQYAPDRRTIGRRVFLGALAVGSIARVPPIPAVATTIGEPAQDRCKALYRNSSDVETFYRVNRYP